MASSSELSSSSSSSTLVGRVAEMEKLGACLKAKKNVLLEGPVGVGKTHLALAATGLLKRPIFRVDGDSRYSEQKLSGWFDPPSVIQKGFSADSFIPGPLVEAMRVGGVLFINELNRLPEGVQNILLPAIDENLVVIPRLGDIRAAEGFLVVATQNPKEFVATSHLSEAILDRFELVAIDYQPEDEECEIVSGRLGSAVKKGSLLPLASVKLCRLTRDHPKVRRGASVRAALSVAEIAHVLIGEGFSFDEAFLRAALMALPTRIEIERDAELDKSAHSALDEMVKDLAKQALEEAKSCNVKKNT